MKKLSNGTVHMIVVMATVVVSVLLHTETDQNARKMAISSRLGTRVFGSGLADGVSRVIRNTFFFFLALYCCCSYISCIQHTRLFCVPMIFAVY